LEDEMQRFLVRDNIVENYYSGAEQELWFSYVEKFVDFTTSGGGFAD
jgi:hypothetical protein